MRSNKKSIVKAEIKNLEWFVRYSDAEELEAFRSDLCSLICAVRDDEREVCASELKRAGLGSSARRLILGVKMP